MIKTAKFKTDLDFKREKMIMMHETDYADPRVTSTAALPTSSSLPGESGFLGGQMDYNGPPPCTGCGQVILDQFILRVQGRLWHADCLRCGACHSVLAGNCFVRGSQVFCPDDFFRLFGARCIGCNLPIAPSEQVRRAHENVYHPACFTCVGCDVELKTGDEFYLRDDGKLICRHDYDLAKDKEESDSGSDQPSPKRARVFISSEQTEILQKVYKRYKRPSRQTMDKLCKDTSLDVKTVQVWFQNQRAGEKKIEATSIWSDDNRDEQESRVPGCKHGSSPAPIVNREFSGNFAPKDERNKRPNTKQVKSTDENRSSHWSMSDDMWSADFVPPNIELTPEDIKDGEVCSSRNMRKRVANDVTSGENNIKSVTSGVKSDNSDINCLTSNLSWLNCPN